MIRKRQRAATQEGGTQQTPSSPDAATEEGRGLEEEQAAGGSGLATRIRVLVTQPPEDPPSWKAVAGGESLEARAALYADVGFWAAPFWAGTDVAPGTVREAVDPLADLPTWCLGLPDGGGRARAIRALAEQVPGASERILRDGTLREAVTGGLGTLDRIRVLTALARPDLDPDSDPYILVQQAVVQGDAAQVRAAWSEASMDPGIAVRLARDLELRQRIGEVDPELANQVDWELSRTLDGVVLDSVEAVFETAARPALRALEPLSGGWLLWAPDAGPMVAAVEAYLADARARVPLLDPDASGASVREGALAFLKSTLKEFFGDTIDAGLARLVTVDGLRLRGLLGFVDSAGESGGGEGDGDGGDGSGGNWEETLRASARAQAVVVHRASTAASDPFGFGPSSAEQVLDALEASKKVFREKAAEDGARAAAVEGRVAQAMRWLAEAYEVVYGPLGVLLQSLDDAGQRARAEELLGREGSGADRAVDAVLASLEPDANTAAEAAMVELTDHARSTGRELALAVQDDDEQRAEQLAEQSFRLFSDRFHQNVVSKDAQRAVVPVMEEAYAPLGGSFRGGVASLDNADTVFSLLGMHSTGAALRRDGDDRSDDVLAAEYRVDESLRMTFDAVATADSNAVHENLTTAGIDVAHLIPETRSDPAFEPAADTYLATRYCSLFGVDLGTHIARSDLRASSKAHFGKRFPAGATSPVDALPEASEDEDTVEPGYFTIGGTPAGVDPAAVSDWHNIKRMTRVHVERLTELAEALSVSWTWMFFWENASSAAPELLKYVAELTFHGELDRVERAFTEENQATLGFYVRQAEAQGTVSGDTSAGLQRDLEGQEISALSKRLLQEADRKDWSRLLEQSEGAGVEERSVVLAEDETMATLRDRVDVEVVWRALFDSLNGRLQLSDLLRDESDLQDWMEFVGTALWWTTAVASLGIVPLLNQLTGLDAIESTFGVDESEEIVNLDVGAIVGARRQELGWQEGTLDGARAAVDGDVGVKLDRVESADGKLDSLNALGRSQVLPKGTGTDTRERLGDGGAGMTAAAQVDDDLWQVHNLRDAILSMSAEERALSARDPVFLDRITTLTEGHPGAEDELYALLFAGGGAAEAKRLQSLGHGVEWNLFDDPWTAVDGFSRLSVDEQAEAALSPEGRQPWILATAGSPDAQAALLAMMDASTDAAGASWEAEQSDAGLAGGAAAAPAQRAFVLRAVSRLRASFMDVEQDAVSAVITAAADVAREARALTDEAADPQTATAPEGWLIGEAMRAVWLEVGAEVQQRFAPQSLVGTTDDLDRGLAREEHGDEAVEHYSFTTAMNDVDAMVKTAILQWHSESLGSVAVLAYRSAGSSMDVAGMVRAIGVLSNEDVAREFTNFTAPGVDGSEAFEPVYRAFSQARAAREAAEEAGGEEGESAELTRLRADEQLRMAEVAKHPIDVRAGANLVHADARLSSNHALSDFSGPEQDAIKKALRGRIQKLPEKLVLEQLRAETRDKDLVWGAQRQAALIVSGSRDKADRSLTYDPFDIGTFTSSDDEAAGRYLALADGYQRILADRKMSPEEQAELEALSAEFEVSLSEFLETKQKVADAVSKVVAGLVSAAVTAATGGAAAPVVAALLVTALAGGADIIIHEALLGDDYESDDAFAELCVDLLKTAITAQLAQGWQQGGEALQQALVRGPAGRKLILGLRELEGATRSAFGEFGAELVTGTAAAGLEGATGGLKDAALSMLDPTMYKHGWDRGLAEGLAGLEGAVMGMDDAALDAILAEVADQLGTKAGEAATGAFGPGRSAAGREAFGKDKERDPHAPDPRKEPGKYRDYLIARLKKIPGEAAGAAAKDGVTGLTLQTFREAEEYVTTGDTSIQASLFADEVKDAGKAGLKAGRKVLTQSFNGARKDRKAAREAHAVHQTHLERMKALKDVDHGLSDAELAQFEVWASQKAFSPDGGMYKERGVLDGNLQQGRTEGWDQLAHQEELRPTLVEPTLRMEITEFRNSVLAPLQGQLTRHRQGLGADLSDADLDAYEAWVMADPKAMTSRVKTDPVAFTERRRQAADALAEEKASLGYAHLSPHEKAWFDQAAKDPTRVADLAEGSTLSVSVSSPDALARYREDLAAVQVVLAGEVLDEIYGPEDGQTAEDLGPTGHSRYEFLSEHKADFLKGIELSVSDEAANRKAVQQRVDAFMKDRKEADILERLVVTPSRKPAPEAEAAASP